MIGNECSYPGCGVSHKLKKGLCGTHYMRQYRTGSEFTVRPPGLPGDGRRKHFMYGAWAAMINRCHNPNNSSFGRYGAKGVAVCDRWRKDFAAFLSDMGERPEGMTLDRIDPYGDYSPDNCRWADKFTQRKNHRREADEYQAEATSKAVKGYWRQWRADRGLPEHAPTRKEYKTRNKPENPRPIGRPKKVQASSEVKP